MHLNMDKASEIEKELIKLGGSNASNKTENHSKSSDRGANIVAANISEKNAQSTKSENISGTRQGDHSNGILNNHSAT